MVEVQETMQKGVWDYLACCNKNTNPEFSRIRGGGSTSDISICCIDFEMSSTENGMLHWTKKAGSLLSHITTGE